MGKRKPAGILAGVIIFGALLAWVSTAPYLSNQGLGRTPGIIIGGTPTEAPGDFTPLNESIRGPMFMKQSGFPPFVNYLTWVGTPEGVITATRPDGGLWAQRVRDRGGNGWLRIGEATYAMEAVEIFGDERIAMLEQWSAKSGMPMDTPVGGPEPLRDFFWSAR